MSASAFPPRVEPADRNLEAFMEKSGSPLEAQFRIRRFRLVDGREIKLYCRLLKSRPGIAASFSLYEDNRGLKWMEICLNAVSCLMPMSDASFEQQVAEELLTLGFNKYSG